MWNHGDVIVERHPRDDVEPPSGFGWAAPMWVWSDDGQRLVTFVPIGTLYQRIVDASGLPTRSFGASLRAGPVTWTGNHVLNITCANDEFGIKLFFGEDWRLRCWYVNLQTPMRRHAMGIETVDLTLDLLIAPDLSGHQWKDEDEFAERVDAGMYGADELRRLKAVGRTVLQRAQGRSAPFDEPWPQWRPPAEWGIPAFPPGWDR
jgi:hypothetical protein